MVQKVNTKSVAPASLPFSPSEYRDIPRGHYLSCALRLKGSRDSSNWLVVGEGELLFGTMRAYLGNMWSHRWPNGLIKSRPFTFTSNQSLSGVFNSLPCTPSIVGMG